MEKTHGTSAGGPARFKYKELLTIVTKAGSIEEADAIQHGFAVVLSRIMQGRFTGAAREALTDTRLLPFKKEEPNKWRPVAIQEVLPRMASHLVRRRLGAALGRHGFLPAGPGAGRLGDRLQGAEAPEPRRGGAAER